MMANRIPRKEETQEDYTKIGMVGSAYPKAGIGDKQSERREAARRMKKTNR
jgi:hypothetical protein